MDFLVEDSDLTSGLNFEIFEGNWNRLPDFNQLTPVSSGVADTITLDLPELTQDQDKEFNFDTFGARFTGFIEVPRNDTYTFYTTSDDGSQLLIGETVVVNNDGLHAARERSGEIELTAGKHPLTVTFFEKFGEETLSVSLEGGGLSKQVLPATNLFREGTTNDPPLPDIPTDFMTGLSFELFEGNWNRLPDFDQLTPVDSGIADTITLDLPERTQESNFGARFTGFIEVPRNDTYTFYTTSDDGSQLLIGETVVVNNDGLHAARERSGEIELTAGKHPLTVTFFEKFGEETLSVSLEGGGLSKQVLPATNLFREGTTNDPPLPDIPTDLMTGLSFELFEGNWNRLPDFDQLTPVDSGIADTITLDLPERTQESNFGARFTGFIEVPRNDTYTFYTTSDDGSQLLIGETVVVNNDGLHAARERSGEIELTAGKHPLTVTFFEKFGEETLSVSLEGGGLSKQVLPATNLFRERTTDSDTTNQAPDAVDDSVSTTLDQSVTVDVLANDRDSDGDSLSLSIDTPSSNGNVMIDNNDTPKKMIDDLIKYTPNQGFEGDDSFTYQVDDGKGGIDTATVEITVKENKNHDPQNNDSEENRSEPDEIRDAELWELEEWSLNNPTWSGNPFDLVATVTFDHQGSNASHTTAMFYDGNDTWRFRFTGTQTGTWNFETSSTDSDLDDLTGTIQVQENTDPNAVGFMVEPSIVERELGAGEKWARYKGNNGELEVFVPQLLMVGMPSRFEDPAQVAQDIDEFIIDHGFTGFHVADVGALWFDIDQGNSFKGATEKENPDPDTFEAIEELIIQTRNEGGMVHLWLWGDQGRGQTPHDLRGGINGSVDQRLNRYLAARLGPIPGWSAGYGFDLDEWVNESQLHQWRDDLQNQLGWYHLLGGRPEGPNSGDNHNEFQSWNAGLDYSSYEHHKPDYEAYREALTTVSGQPTMSEDRFRIRNQGRSKDYTEARTRRGLYHSTLAGGVANIWGNYLDDWDPEQISQPYSNQEQLKTYSTFFFEKGRFISDLEPADGLVANGYALKTSDNDRYIFYAENTDGVELDLSGMSASQSVIAVNTRREYQEIPLGTLNPQKHTINLPSSSDWVIAVGNWSG